MQAALREFAPLFMREASATVLPFASGHLPRPPPPAYIYIYFPEHWYVSLRVEVRAHTIGAAANYKSLRATNGAASPQPTRVLHVREVTVAVRAGETTVPGAGNATRTRR